MISTYLFGQTFYTQFGEKKEIVGSKTYHDLGECYHVNSNYPSLQERTLQDAIL